MTWDDFDPEPPSTPTVKKMALFFGIVFCIMLGIAVMLTILASSASGASNKPVFIFSDGFETGKTDAWSAVVGEYQCPFLKLDVTQDRLDTEFLVLTIAKLCRAQGDTNVPIRVRNAQNKLLGEVLGNVGGTLIVSLPAGATYTLEVIDAHMLWAFHGVAP